MASVTVTSTENKTEKVELTSDFCFGQAAKILLGQERSHATYQGDPTVISEAWRKLGESISFAWNNE